MKKTHSRNTIAIMDRIISNRSRFDSFSKCFELEYDEIPYNDLEELNASFLIDNEDYANEVTGCDNDLFESKMLPSLVKLLQESHDKDNVYEFVNTWKKSTLAYGREKAERLLSERLSEYNFLYHLEAV